MTHTPNQPFIDFLSSGLHVLKTNTHRLIGQEEDQTNSQKENDLYQELCQLAGALTDDHFPARQKATNRGFIFAVDEGKVWLYWRLPDQSDELTALVYYAPVIYTNNIYNDTLDSPSQNFDQYGDWIDLRTPEAITAKAGDTVHINLGFSAQLPEGFEAHMTARSSTFPKYGLLLGNSIGIIDNSYSGIDDLWQANFYATRDVEIDAGTRLLQFRLVPTMSHMLNDELLILDSPERLRQNDNRGGIGSTGTH